MRYIIAFSLVFISSLCMGYDYYSYTSVRGAALGGVFYPDGISGSFINPVSLMRSDQSHLMASYYMLYGSRFNLIGLGEVSDNYAYGFSYINFSRSDIEIRNNITDIAGYANNSFNSFMINGGMRLPYNLIGGANLKIAHQNIYDVESNYGYGLDLGLSKNIFVIGSRLKNLYSINCSAGISNIAGPVMTISGNNEPFPSTSRLSLEASMTLFPRYNIERETLDYDKFSLYYDNVMSNLSSSGFGIEYGYKNFLLLRTGLNSSGYSFGVGIGFESIDLNYSMISRDFSQLHLIDIVYRYGESHGSGSAPDELQDYLEVYRKAQRIYDKMYRDSVDLFEQKNYSSCIELLGKILPINPSKKDASELLALSVKSANIDKINLLKTQYDTYLSEKDYTKAYEKVLEALDICYYEPLAVNMLEDFKRLNIDKSAKDKIAVMNKEKASVLKNNVDTKSMNNDFEGLEDQINLLKVISSDAESVSKIDMLYRQRRDKYVSESLGRAMIYLDKLNFENAYIELQNAHAVSKDKEIEYQIDKTEKMYNKSFKKSLTERIYQKKLYYLACISLSTDEVESAKQYYNELRQRNVFYSKNELEKALKKYK